MQIRNVSLMEGRNGNCDGILSLMDGKNTNSLGQKVEGYLRGAKGELRGAKGS